MPTSRQFQILALIIMSLVGIGLGVWLFRSGFVALGCALAAIFLWRLQQSAVWFVSPAQAPSDFAVPFTSTWQRLLLSFICLLGAAVIGVGIYLWRLWPEEWQAALVFVLFGSLVLAPVTLKEIQSRRNGLA